MRRAGRVVAEMHAVHPRGDPAGVTTAELDQIGRDVTRPARRPLELPRLRTRRSPAVICASPNDVIVARRSRVRTALEEGDIISIDCGAIVDGWHGDAAFTARRRAGRPRGAAPRSTSPRRRLDAAIDADGRPGGRLSDIGHAVQARGRGGRLLGRAASTRATPSALAMHEKPDVPELRASPARAPSSEPGRCSRSSRW